MKGINTLHRIGFSKERFSAVLGTLLHDLRNAMEVNEFEKGREVGAKLHELANHYRLDDLSEACRWLGDICQQKNLSEFFKAFQVIEIIASRHSDPLHEQIA